MTQRELRLIADLDAICAEILGRSESLLAFDLEAKSAALREGIEGKRLLVTGAAGSIGAATVHQLAGYAPASIVAIDLSENNLAELVRDFRSRPVLREQTALETYVVDFGSDLGERFVQAQEPFDQVLHFAAMKHVRSERDPFTLARMLQTNVLGVDRFLGALKASGPCEVFAVSTDKACRPANFMGASKRLMESVVCWHADHPGSLAQSGTAAPIGRVAMARFANVAFSQGSLLGGFLERIRKGQPLAGPSDVRRYFIREEEAGQLCLLGAVLAGNKQILVPRFDADRDAKRFNEIAAIVLRACGYEPEWYENEGDARRNAASDVPAGRYPCCFGASDTSGEKEVEEFVAPDEELAASEFRALDVVGSSPQPAASVLARVVRELGQELSRPDRVGSALRIKELLSRAVPSFRHVETGHSLDEKM